LGLDSVVQRMSSNYSRTARVSVDLDYFMRTVRNRCFES
jgi:hypothetical protein